MIWVWILGPKSGPGSGFWVRWRWVLGLLPLDSSPPGWIPLLQGQFQCLVRGSGFQGLSNRNESAMIVDT